MQHLILIDASGFIFRAFHALPPMTSPTGTPVNAVYGFVTMLLKHLAQHTADAIGVVFDAGRITFRQDIYPLYKAHRVETPPELIPQFPLVREACTAFNLPVLEASGYEADDLIATYARAAEHQGMKVTIIASDKDLMQLVTERIRLYDPIKNKPIEIPDVYEKFGVGPEKVIDVQALAGDASDNIPGVPGIGLKTAAALINEFGSVEALLNDLTAVTQPKRRHALETYCEQAIISKQLVELRTDAPMPLPISALASYTSNPDMVRTFLRTMGFRSLLNKFKQDEVSAPSTLAVTSPPQNSTPANAPPVMNIARHSNDLALWGRQYMQGADVAIVPIADQGNIIGVALAAAMSTLYIPNAHLTPSQDLFARSALVPGQIPVTDIATLPQPARWITYNAKDLWHLSHVWGQPIQAEDISLISYLQGHTGSPSELAARHSIPYPPPFPTKQRLELLSIDDVANYATAAASSLLQLYRYSMQSFPASLQNVYDTIEKPLIPVLGRMEAVGVLVDRTTLARLSQDFHQRAHNLEQEIFTLVGRVFNLASPKQLEEVLREDLIRAGAKKGKSGQYSTDASILEELATQGHQVATLIMAWRQLTKLISTYTEALTHAINPHTGRIHTVFSMTATATGRLASSHPNLQNIPIRTEDGRKIRTAFIAAPDHVLVSMDYSQIELRLLAHFADVPTIRQAFAEGIDIHALTASQVFHIPLTDITPERRRQAKAINFGIIYGISAYGLARQLSIPQAEASEIIKVYFRQYPGIQAYMEAMKATAKQHGFVETLYGRRCFTPEIHSRNPTLRQFAERQAINAPLQGSNADIIKLAMIKLDTELPRRFPGTHLGLQVHDELLFEVPTIHARALIDWAREIMTHAAPRLHVPLVVDAKQGSHWGL